VNKLLLGSGSWHWEGWTTLDASPSSGADHVATIPPLPYAVRSRCWTIIQAIHFVEHLCPWDAETLLRQCYACLEPGGVLVLEQPDIRYAARVLLGEITPPPGEVGQFDMWPLYGDPTHRDPLMMHRWGYSPDTLADLLVQAGFERERISVKPARFHVPVRDFRMEGLK
jgi:hypothetical protein